MQKRPSTTLTIVSRVQDMLKHVSHWLVVTLLATASVQAQQQTITIGMVNNPDMLELKKLSTKFTEENPDIKLDWVILEENMLRQRITTDLTFGSGLLDLVFIGLYDAPIFAKRGYLRPIGELPAD